MKHEIGTLIHRVHAATSYVCCNGCHLNPHSSCYGLSKGQYKHRQLLMRSTGGELWFVFQKAFRFSKKNL